MRVTQSMLQNNMLRNIFKSQAQMDKYLEQINTGKKIRKPSDDPVIAMKGIGYRTEVTEVAQYRRNSGEVWNWMDHSDDVLDKATKVMQRLEYLAVQAANDTYSESERNSILEEVEQLEQQMIDLANTKVNGKFIFNGTDTDKPPIGKNGDVLTFPEDVKDVIIEVSKGISIQANVNPKDIFNETLFNSIQNFKTALETGENISTSIEELNQGMISIVDGRAALGARMNRLELIDDRLEHQEIIATDIMKKNEGVDFEEAVTNLLTQEVLHRAALSASAKIIQPSLIDFLR